MCSVNWCANGVQAMHDFDILAHSTIGEASVTLEFFDALQLVRLLDDVFTLAFISCRDEYENLQKLVDLDTLFNNTLSAITELPIEKLHHCNMLTSVC